MKQALVVLAFLTIFVWTVVSVPGQIKKSCCLTASAQPPHYKKLTNYEIQENDGRCNIKAVIFYTITNRTICSNPANKRIKMLMKRFRLKV
ncbi:eotaxin-like [Callorhinchus milii]|uniref:C-C motif chemokine 17-like n=1 Tax=Callorhinchus milii TaxID=7868 RepID=A0A4W3JS99_CALMI|nr:eotaxin-like [Callorhinchus milii]|eukprot:gi/632934554/ref/XP_007885461.1/ PREDICTED: C-C motif chemokine 17-like [Callorhinchus milii]